MACEARVVILSAVTYLKRSDDFIIPTESLAVHALWAGDVERATVLPTAVRLNYFYCYCGM